MLVHLPAQERTVNVVLPEGFPGHRAALVGESCVGKTTLFHVLNEVMKPGGAYVDALRFDLAELPYDDALAEELVRLYRGLGFPEITRVYTDQGKFTHVGLQWATVPQPIAQQGSGVQWLACMLWYLRRSPAPWLFFDCLEKSLHSWLAGHVHTLIASCPKPVISVVYEPAFVRRFNDENVYLVTRELGGIRVRRVSDHPYARAIGPIGESLGEQIARGQHGDWF